MITYENRALAPYTTMNIGGNAKRLVEAESADDVLEALKLAADEPVFILGAGSNLLVDDEGFDGTVIHPVFKGVEWMKQDDGSTIVEIEAGAMFDDVVAESCRQNLGGIEALSGIPGSAGGSLVQNIGAYGQEISETFVSAKAVSIKTREIVELSRDDMDFSYRHTSLKSAQNELVVLSITLRLEPFNAEKAIARCIDHGFKKLVQNPPKNADELRNLILETRRSKRMCYDKGDFNTHSVGSFFVNPVVNEIDAQRLNAESITRTNRPMPSYPATGGVKLSAAWLIEQAGFAKGYGYKGAALSAFHCLAIVNRQNATSKDVCEFAGQIVNRVSKTFRVKLSPEVVYLAKNGIVSLNLE